MTIIDIFSATRAQGKTDEKHNDTNETGQTNPSMCIVLYQFDYVIIISIYILKINIKICYFGLCFFGLLFCSVILLPVPFL